MSDEHEPPAIKVTDRRHFDRSGEKRPDDPGDPGEPEPSRDATREASAQAPPGEAPRAAQSPNPKRAEPPPVESGRLDLGGETASGPAALPGDLSDVAMGLSSSFSLLIARLAQETEIYLGLVPYPGKETAEPDLEAARAMIDVLSMLQEKTRGNLDDQESHLLENLLYTYRLEFVRRRSGGDIR